MPSELEQALMERRSAYYRAKSLSGNQIWLVLVEYDSAIDAGTDDSIAAITDNFNGTEVDDGYSEEDNIRDTHYEFTSSSLAEDACQSLRSSGFKAYRRFRQD